MILQVLPEARRVRVTLAAAAYLASIWFPIVMRSLMLCPIAAVAERFRAAVVLARVRPLSGVRSLVNLQVLQATESFLATSKRTLVRLLLRVHAHVNEQFVPRVKRPRARTSLPQAGEFVLAAGRRRRRDDAVGGLLAFLALPVPLYPPAVAVRVPRRGLDVPPLDVPHQALLLREGRAAVDPPTLVSRRQVIVHRLRAIVGLLVPLVLHDFGPGDASIAEQETFVPWQYHLIAEALRRANDIAGEADRRQRRLL